MIYLSIKYVILLWLPVSTITTVAGSSGNTMEDSDFAVEVDREMPKRRLESLERPLCPDRETDVPLCMERAQTQPDECEPNVSDWTSLRRVRVVFNKSLTTDWSSSPFITGGGCGGNRSRRIIVNISGRKSSKTCDGAASTSDWSGYGTASTSGCSSDGTASTSGCSSDGTASTSGCSSDGTASTSGCSSYRTDRFFCVAIVVFIVQIIMSIFLLFL